MFLKALEVGDEFVISKLDDDTYWDGFRFVSDIESAKRFESHSGAAIEMFEIEDQQCDAVKQQTFILPVTVRVTGDVTRQEIGEYLNSAAKLIMNRDDLGNGPSPGSYVEPEIHWHLIKEMPDRLDEDPDEPDHSWGYYLTLDDI